MMGDFMATSAYVIIAFAVFLGFLVILNHILALIVKNLIDTKMFIDGYKEYLKNKNNIHGGG